MTEEEVRKIIRDELSDIIKPLRFILPQNAQILDGKNIQLGTLNGTKIGTGITEKLAFFGQTPVDKPETVADPTGGATVDGAARGAINELIDRLQELGLIK